MLTLPLQFIDCSVKVYSNLKPKWQPVLTLPLQVIDCSVKVYSSIQSETRCQDGGPFCTSYHRRTEARARTGIYYALKHTLHEVPYAWFHKCMMLHSRPFRGNGDLITCREWNTDSIEIGPKGLQFQTGVLDKLRRIEGGLTSQGFLESQRVFEEGLADAVSKYMASAKHDDFSEFSSESQDDVTRYCATMRAFSF